MKTRLQVPLFTLLLTLLCLGLSSDGWGQTAPINETFTSIGGGTSSSYLNRTWTGDQGGIWNATDARTDQTVYSGNDALLIRNGLLTSPVVSGGIGNLTLSTQRKFGGGSGNLTVLVNDVVVGTIPYDDTVQTSTINDINIPGNVVVKIQTPGNGDRIAMDNLIWTAYAASEPFLTVTPSSLSGFGYTEGDSTSPSQSFELSGSNLVVGEVTLDLSPGTNFEISADDTNFFEDLSIPDYNGASTIFYVRLKTGLTANTYFDDIVISGGGADPVSVNLEGTVIEPFGLPYFNGLRNQTDWDEAETLGFVFDGTSFQTTADGYVRLPLNAYIESAPIDFSDYNLIMASFDITTFGGNTGQELTVFVSDNNGMDYTALDTFSVPGSYETFTRFIDVSALSGANGRIKFEMTGGSNSIRFRDLDLGVYEGYFYNNAEWVPLDPAGVSTAADDLLVLSGEAPLTANTIANNITVHAGASLEVQAVLTVNGLIDNEGTITFKSTSIANTAQLDTFTGSITGAGQVTVERFIPARRAFRFLSSAVTTTGNIRANWQEGQNNTGTIFPDDNQNNVPGYGTHITGSQTGDNGFDATPGGNPSLFTLNNTTQSWEAVENTDVNTIAAGTAYRLFVRGDRSVNVTSNSAVPTNTILRTTGTLHTGTFTFTGLSEVENDFNFFGNPYPAIVDMNALLALPANNNINPNSYYIWDPNMNTRGAYVAVDLDPEALSPDQYLQPGQAAFVRTLANGVASLTFEESHKAVDQPLTQVFNVQSKIDLRLFTASAFAQNESAADGLKIKFSEAYTNAVTPLDATKFYNLDENLATTNNGTLLSIESRALPLEGESIPLFTNQYRNTDYVFEAILTDITGVTAVLRDHYTGTDTDLIADGISLYTFNVDPADANSIAEDRFEIVFEELLSTNDVTFGNGFVLFPNPAGDRFTMATKGISGDKVTVSITNVLGQTLYNKAHTVETNGQLSINANTLTPGVYTVKLTHANGRQFTTKLIKK